MFKNAPDYAVPLLKLLDSLPGHQGEREFVLREFEQRYREQIPVSHYESRVDGTRWIVYVRHSWHKVRRRGWMDAPASGLWHLTEAGHSWLANHPAAKTVDKESQSLTAEQEDHPRRYLAFLGHVQEIWLAQLPGEVRSRNPVFRIRGNTLQMRLPHFGSSHYEVRLSSHFHEIALHFESNAASRNEARRKVFEAQQAQLSATLGDEVRVEPWKHWARVWLKLPLAALTPEQAEAYGPKMAHFVAATYPILCVAYNTLQTATGPEARYAVLDQEVEAIRAFLEGRTEQRPSAEKICDWIQFSYTFGLFEEASKLFGLVSPQEVNNWYFDRARKLARICELKARPK